VEALGAFRAAHGGCPRGAVPAGGSWQFTSDRCGRAVHISQRALRAWLAEQRRGHRRGVLRADQEEHLAALGVGWARRALAARLVRCFRTPRPARAPGEAACAGRSPRGHQRFMRVLKGLVNLARRSGGRPVGPARPTPKAAARRLAWCRRRWSTLPLRTGAPRAPGTAHGRAGAHIRAARPVRGSSRGWRADCVVAPAAAGGTGRAGSWQQAAQRQGRRPGRWTL